ncbi:MAG: hypothetical protein ACRDYX_22925 [Egibacteraceae bacterium]
MRADPGRTSRQGRSAAVADHTFRTFAEDLEALGDWLASQGVTLVVMEPPA